MQSLCGHLQENAPCLIQDADHIGMLVYQLWQTSSSFITQNDETSNTLIFCPSRIWTENLAKTLSTSVVTTQQTEIYTHQRLLPQIVLFEASRRKLENVAAFVDSFFLDPRRQALVQTLERIASPDDMNPLLRITIPIGVAFHHGGTSRFTSHSGYTHTHTHKHPKTYSMECIHVDCISTVNLS